MINPNENQYSEWQAASQKMIQAMPAAAKPWLLDSYILTQHLQAAGQWKLKVLQAWKPQENGDFERRIVHQVDGKPVVYAEVLMPAATYERYKPSFGELGDKPLGETLLYHNAAVKRSPFEYVLLGSENELFKRASSALSTELLWARKSTFYWQNLPIIVIEVFIPDMPPFGRLPRWKQWLRNTKHTVINYAYLVRLHRPIPILLMLWPTLWGLWIASNGIPELKYILIFIAGVVVMRSAGDILNDLADRKLDGFIERTKMRPLATGRISVVGAWILTFILCLIALGLVLLLNRLCLWLAIIGLALAVIYPFMKRITRFPQVVLGVAYNWGVVMAFAAVQNKLPWQAWYLLVVTVVWTVAYDSMYALADIKDDVKIGIKSTVVFFGQHYAYWIGALQALTIIGLLIFGTVAHYDFWYFVSVLAAIPFFIYQHTLLPGHQINRCIQAFNNNQWVGLLVWLGIVSTF